MDRFNNTDTSLGPREMGVLKILLMFSFLMLIVPVFAYFFMKSYIFEGILGYENGSVSAAIGTVVLIHIIIGWYIWIAVKEEQKEQQVTKKD